MCKAGRMLVITLAATLSLAAIADDATDEAVGQQPPAEVTASVEALLSSPEYAFGWALPSSLEPFPYSDTRLQPVADFSFQDSSALGRVSKLRYLSLFTLMETGQTRLFLGVNDDGLLGLHFNAVSEGRDERFLELVRMPYLAEPEQVSDAQGDN